MTQGRCDESTQRPNDATTPDLRLWYVVQTKPGNEHRVETNLSNEKIETFLPLFAQFQYFQGKKVQKIRPLFPNYLFAKLDIELHYYKVKWARGVNRILRTNSGPVPISEKVVQAIRERIGEDNLIKTEEEIVKGNIVQITSGPLKDLMGVFEKKMSDGGRVRILLSLIGVDVPVQISRWRIKKVA